MLLDNEKAPQSADFDALFSRTAGTRERKTAEDILQSALIRSFEQAIEEGVEPIEALTAILGWVSCEMARITVEARAGGI